MMENSCSVLIGVEPARSAATKEQGHPGVRDGPADVNYVRAPLARSAKQDNPRKRQREIPRVSKLTFPRLDVTNS
jgi:hypothetical protein